MKRLPPLLLVLLWPAAALAANADGSQVVCHTGSAVVVGAATGRMSLCAYNNDSTNPAYINQAGTTAGYIVPAGQGRCFDARTQADGGFSAETTVKCRSTGADVTLHLWESWR